jgi:hypothetical protein
MKALTETEEFSAKDLKDINRCRIYLWVFYISDVSTHDGQGITDWAWKGREGKERWRKEVILVMASSTSANLVESMETCARLLNSIWLCCTAAVRLACTASPAVIMVSRS